jgi:NADP-dependent 3-hydroxy acid dehydrogenase YdfG
LRQAKSAEGEGGGGCAAQARGQALALRYHRAGWRLALVARRADAVQQWAAAQAIPAADLLVLAADVRDVAAITAAGRACIAQAGLPDVVIANAGISVGMDSAERADLQVMADTFATNNLGLAATFHPFLAPMRERRRGTLVGVASVAASTSRSAATIFSTPSTARAASRGA